MNRHIKKISSYAVIGSMSAFLVTSLSGCGGTDEQQASQPAEKPAIKKEGATVTIEEKPPGTFKIVDEVPSATTRVILRDANGTERILSQAEIDKLVKEEEAKVEAGTSKLTQPPEEVAKDGGMGLAGTLMASMAGAMVGSYLMNKLMNNQNYQQNRRMTYKSPQVYSRSQSSFAKARAGGGFSSTKKSTTSAPRKTGFFSSKSKSSSSSSRSVFGG